MKSNKSANLTYFVLWAILVSVVLIIGAMKKDNIEKGNINPNFEQTNANIVEQTNENMTNDFSKIKGAWISYISLSNHDNSEQSFKDMYTSYVIKAKNMGITDLFVHVRPFSDALYESEYFPWSHLLTGTQGQDPNYDPLEFMIDITHENGMRFHAWINPMRVKLSTIPSSLASNNPYNMYCDEKPYYFFEKDGSIYLNPAYKEMRTLIAKGAAEIVEKYDVDGIHFDDYFYPQDMGDLDSSAYELYTQTATSPISIEKWREANINTMIAQVYREIKLADSEVLFGISPQGNQSNNLLLGANAKTWCKTPGYIDYICPQIYYSYENPSLKFEDCLNSWLDLDKHENLKMYVGLAAYKVGTDSDNGTWLTAPNTLSNQMSESLEKTNGYILYELNSIK